MKKIEMVIDSVRVALMNYQRVVLLREKGGKRYLPIWVGTAEADAIAFKIQGISVPRPLTHDFICSIIKELGAVLKQVIVYELIEDTFHAKASLQRESKVIEIEGKVIEVDCRPSDAFATAVRAEAPIFVTEEILEKAGITTNEINELNESGEESRTRLLVVDDDRLFLKFMASLLADEGHGVETAVNGNDALKKIKSKKYSLLLTGIRMPRMDGFELYEHIKKIDKSLANKTIFISGTVTAADAQKFFAKNKVPYFGKPVDVKKLKRRINRMLSKGT